MLTPMCYFCGVEFQKLLHATVNLFEILHLISSIHLHTVHIVILPFISAIDHQP